MAEFFDIQSTRVVALKKAGSSSIRAMLSNRAGSPAPTSHIICFIRNPYARLVSGWSDLVAERDYAWAKPHYPTEYDAKDFREWAKVIVSIRSEEMDHHFCPQYDELQTVFGQTQALSTCQLWLGHLEKLEKLSNQLDRLTGGHGQITGQNKRTSLHLPWHEYYDDELLGLVGSRFKKDVQMWLALNPEGWYETPYGLNYRDDLDRLIAEAT